VKILSTAWLRERIERLPELTSGMLAERGAVSTFVANRWRLVTTDEHLPERFRGVCILLLILLLSQASARLTWALLTPPPTVPPAVLLPARSGQVGLTDSGVTAALGEKLAALHLFGQAEPRTQAAAATAMIDAPKTTLSLTLKGLVATKSTDRGLAVIADQGKEKVYGIGDQVPGNATIEAIFPDRVILRRAGQLETLYLEKREKKLPAPSAPASSMNQPVTEDNQRQLSHQYLDQTLANLPDLASQVEVHLHKPEGGRHGLRLVAPQGSEFLKNIGMQTGDILYEVNGIPLSDAGAAMIAFEQLRNANNIQVVFERNGAQRQATIAIR